MTSTSMPRTVRYALAVLMTRLHQVKEFVQLVEVSWQRLPDGVADEALLQRVTHPAVRLGMPHDGVDFNRQGFVRGEEVDEGTAGAVVSPVGVLGVRGLRAELLRRIEQLGEVCLVVE